MSVKNWSISVDHPFNTYSGGQQVRGTIHFDLEEPKNVRGTIYMHRNVYARGIYVKYKGIAEAFWTERKPRSRTADRKRPCVRVIGGNTRRDFTPYKGDHVYFNDKVYFVGENEGVPFDLAPGPHDYKFQYDLPVGIPPSFEGTHGAIRYTVKVGFDIPAGFDETQKIALQVILPLDVSKMSHLKMPGQESASKYLCCWCCQSGPLRMDISLPKTGFNKRENIPIMADVENMSRSPVESVEATLKRKMTFYAHDPHDNSKETQEDVCSVELGDVPVRSSRNYNGTLVVPEDVSCNINECSVIKLEYVVEVEAHIRGYYTNLTASIPITIGSVTQISEQSESIAEGLGPPYPTSDSTWFPMPYVKNLPHIDSIEIEQE